MTKKTTGGDLAEHWEDQARKWARRHRNLRSRIISAEIALEKGDTEKALKCLRGEYDTVS
jgi:hypothetical protein